jgi:hypothetical protein
MRILVRFVAIASLVAATLATASAGLVSASAVTGQV